MTFVRLPAGTPEELVALQAEVERRLRPAPGRQVHLDERTHVYTVAGEVVPSVTEIRRPPMHLREHPGRLEDYDHAPGWAKDRGRKVHELVAETERLRAIGFAPDVGELGLEPEVGDLQPFLDAWEAFRRAVGWVTFAVEYPLEGVLWTTCEACGMTTCAHREPAAVRYAGTLDLLGVMMTPPPFFPVDPSGIVVVDLKTGGSMPQSVGAQVALYVGAVCGYVGTLRGVYGLGLRIGEDGKQIAADGKMILGKKRTKADDGRYPEGWDVVPKRTTFRPITAGDFDKARAAALAWHEARKAELGGDANAVPEPHSDTHLAAAPAVPGAAFEEAWL